MDYHNVTAERIWTSEPVVSSGERVSDAVSTDIVSGDIDKDGHIDLVFGTKDGHAIAVDVLARKVIVDAALAKGPIDHFVLGNLDGDKAQEIIASSGNQLFCIDGLYGDVQWHLTSQKDWGDEGSIDGLTVYDDDGDGSSDLFFFTKRSGGDDGAIDKVMLTKVDGKGKELFSISLPRHLQSLGIEFSMVFSHIEMSDSLVGIVVDRGMGLISGGLGQHLWIVDLTYGDILFYEQYPELTFDSPPIVVEYHLRNYLLIGLIEGSDGLMVFDLDNFTSTLFPVAPRPGYGAYWQHMVRVQDSDDLRISLTGSSATQAVWSFKQGKTIWTYDAPGSRGFPFPPKVLDIDSDGQAEIICSFGYPVIFDASTGMIEFGEDEFSTHGGGDGRIAVDDFDGDGHSEICGGSGYFYRLSGDGPGLRFQIYLFDSSPVAPGHHQFPPARVSDASIGEWISIPIIVLGTSAILVTARMRATKKRPD
jgi:hypothetical protein